MKNHHIFFLRAFGVLVAALVFAPTVALCYDVYGGGYDSYSGSYSSNWDYEDNSAYDSSYQYDSYSNDSSYSSGGSTGSSGSTDSSDTGTGTVSSNATVKAGASVAKISSMVTVEVAGGPSNRLDWVGLYEVGAGARNYLDWQYLNGSKAAPSTGRASATLSFKMPATPGNYEFRFFPNNEYTLLAKSGTIDVKTELPAPAPEPDPTPAPTPAATPAATTVDYADAAPAGARLVTIDSYYYVHDAKTNELIDYVTAEISTGKIYRKDNSSLYGRMLSPTTGYINEYITFSGTAADSGSALPVRQSATVDTVAPKPTTVTTKPTATPAPAKTVATAPAPVKTSAVAPAPAVMTTVEVESLNQLIPPGAKIVFVENIDGVYTVFDKETGTAVPLAFYDVNTKNLYYGNSDELYGKMLTENMGYIEPDKFSGALSIGENTSTVASATPTSATPTPAEPSITKAAGDFVKSVVDAVAGFFRSIFSIFKK